MTRCMYVMEDWPITPIAAGGSPALIYSHLELMNHTVDHIDLIILFFPRSSLGFHAYTEDQPEIWKRVSGWCKTIRIIEISPGRKEVSKIHRLLGSLIKPSLYSYGDLIYSKGAKKLAGTIRDLSPDIIWAEHLIPATLIQNIGPTCPVIYSHHDWRWKIKSHRVAEGNLQLKQKLNFWFSKRHETQLVQNATACVSGSASELEEIRSLGIKHLEYFPTTYEAVESPTAALINQRPRIVHLGSMQATANRLGLLRFLRVCWPQLSDTLSPEPELWVIGNLDGATPDLLAALEDKNIICTGIVKDLTTVLRPFDIHIVPWEYNTGTRTRIPLVLNYTQALVSTRAAASCISELADGENCLLVDSLSEMTKVICKLLVEPVYRARIAESGRSTFLRSFTRHAEQDRFSSFLNEIIHCAQV